MSSPAKTVKDWLVGHYREIVAVDQLDLVLRLTMIYLLVKSFGLWYFKVPITLFCIWGLVSPRAARSPVVWFVLTYTLLARVLLNWAVLDNHIYLLGYWSLALFCGLTMADKERSIAISARLLIGLTMVFALIWKGFLSPDYVTGEFMRYTMLTDVRFRDLSLLAGGMAPEQWKANWELLREWQTGNADAAVLFEPLRQAQLAFYSGWFVLLLEAFIGVAFLAPLGSWLSRARHGALLGFAWITYPFATVFGFGWLLMVLGIAQCEPRLRVTRFLYLMTFLVIFFHQFVPWTRVLAESL